MDTLSLIVGICCILTALTIIGLAIPLLRGQVKQNGFYGVRIPEAFDSEEAWYRINRYGARQIIIWSVPMLLAGVVAFVVPLQEHVLVALALGLSPFLILGAVVQTMRYASRNRNAA
jgi:hypothetical protein